MYCKHQVHTVIGEGVGDQRENGALHPLQPHVGSELQPFKLGRARFWNRTCKVCW